MAINKAMYLGVDAIMQAFDRNAQTPYYSVWAGKDMIFSYNDDDIEQGRVYLMENLIASEQNEHSDILKIKFHPKKEKLYITDRTPSIATLFVRVCDPNYMKNNLQPYQPQQNYGLQNILEKQTELLHGLSSRLQALEDVQIEDEENDDEDDTLGKIGTILNHPAVQTLIAALLPQIMPAVKPQQQVAGIENEEMIKPDPEEFETEIGLIDLQENNDDQYNDIEQSLLRLSQHTLDLAGDLKALANMADNNPAQFKMLLSMLQK
jgi:hypothetical protein